MRRIAWNLLYQIQNILVVYKFNVTPIDFLFLIFFLLHLEYMLIKMLLKLFICKIDAELLKAVQGVVPRNQLLDCSGTNFELLQCLETKIPLENEAKRSIPEIPSKRY